MTSFLPLEHQLIVRGYLNPSMSGLFVLQRTITPAQAQRMSTKASSAIVRGEMLYVEYEGDVWHLAHVLRRKGGTRFELVFHDGEEADVDLASEKHCMAEKRCVRLAVACGACFGCWSLKAPHVGLVGLWRGRLRK